jgi:hypothetical protein
MDIIIDTFDPNQTDFCTFKFDGQNTLWVSGLRNVTAVRQSNGQLLKVVECPPPPRVAFEQETLLVVRGRVNGHDAYLHVDSSSGISVISMGFVERFGLIDRIQWDDSVKLIGLNGHPMNSGGRLDSVRVDLNGAQFYVTFHITGDESLQGPLLGQEWASQANPLINYTTKTITFPNYYLQ